MFAKQCKLKEQSMIVEQWKYAGVDCCIREGAIGYCGYVRCPEYNQHLVLRQMLEASAHGGVTWASALPELNNDDTWVGFDTAHLGDCTCVDNYFTTYKSTWTLKQVHDATNKLASSLAQYRKQLDSKKE